METNGDAYPCPLCPKVFVCDGYLKKHLHTHTQGRSYSCDLCPKKYKWRYTLTVHRRHHAEVEVKQFKCEMCLKVLRSECGFLKHRKRHLKEFTDFCNICNMGFVSKQEYAGHMSNKHGPSIHVCNICGRSCCDKYSLQDHILTHEEGYKDDRKYKCDICKKSFYRPRHLKRHVFKAHKDGDEDGFICDFCGKKVTTKESLRDHLLIHEGVKPFSCQLCNKEFTAKKNLKTHARIHSGDKPFVCKNCGKSFTQSSSLTIHNRLHTGERPYVCSICHNRFVSRSLLNSHMKSKNHNVDIMDPVE